MSDFAPRIITIKINPEKIREIIGKGGSMIRKIQEETGTEINVEDDGTVEIAAVSGENSRKAINWIESLTREVEIGALYLGKVTRLMSFGCFVEILPGQGGPHPHRRARRLPRADRRGRRVGGRRGHGGGHRDRPPGPRQPVPQGGDAAAPRQVARCPGIVPEHAPPGSGPGALLVSGARTAGRGDGGVRGGNRAPVASPGASRRTHGGGPIGAGRGRAGARARTWDVAASWSRDAVTGRLEARWYTPPVPDNHPLAGRTMPETSPRPLTVAVVGATGAVGRTMIQVLLEKQVPYARAAPPCLRALGRHAP